QAHACYFSGITLHPAHDAFHARLADVRQQAARYRVALLEDRRLDRQRDLFLPLLCPMVGHRKEKAGHRSQFILVVEPDRIAAAPGLRLASARLRFHLRVCVHLDSLYPQSRYQLSDRTEGTALLKLRCQLPAAFELLFAMRVKTESVGKPETV